MKLKTATLTLLIAFSVPVQAEDSSSFWDSVQEGAANAWDATKEGASDLWESSKEGASELADDAADTYTETKDSLPTMDELKDDIHNQGIKPEAQEVDDAGMPVQ